VKHRSFMIAAVAALLMVVSLGSFLAGSHFGTGSNPSDALNVEGYATIKVLNPAGNTVYTWQGHNMLFDWTISDIAACLSGNTTTSYHFNGCSGWTPWIYVDWQSGNHSYDLSAKSTTALLPAGCIPSSTYAGQLCDGWVAEGTFGPASFTSTNCGTCTITAVTTGGSGSALFDTITTSIPISTGDSLLVSVDFAVT